MPKKKLVIIFSAPEKSLKQSRHAQLIKQCGLEEVEGGGGLTITHYSRMDQSTCTCTVYTGTDDVLTRENSICST